MGQALAIFVRNIGMRRMAGAKRRRDDNSVCGCSGDKDGRTGCDKQRDGNGTGGGDGDGNSDGSGSGNGGGAQRVFRKRKAAAEARQRSAIARKRATNLRR
jgi:hypothetical protein